MRILTIFGTRPEAIKLAPVIKAFEKEKSIENLVCVTAQHRELLDQVLELFNIKPDFDLNLMTPNQTLEVLTISILIEIGKILDRVQPDFILIQGDTTTVFAAALSAYYKKIKIAHLEAGLRTNNIYSPFPEEGNRRLVSALTYIHFAPTLLAKENLLKENILEKNIEVTGNTVIDALFMAKNFIDEDLSYQRSLEFIPLSSQKKIILVTLHRRENQKIIKDLCIALRELAHERNDIQIIFCVHPNPKVKELVYSLLEKSKNIFLILSPDYLKFIYLMEKSYFIVTDSGGIQEEAPSFNKPVLVVRNETERLEGILAGSSILVGTSPSHLKTIMVNFLEDSNLYNYHACIPNPYGDGQASQKIVEFFKNY